MSMLCHQVSNERKGGGGGGLNHLLLLFCKSVYIIELIVEIKQTLQMNDSKTWLERNWSQHQVSSNFFPISVSFFSNKRLAMKEMI